MTLLAFQTALGRSLERGPGAPLADLDLSLDEQARLESLVNSSGFRATAHVRRSWCQGRVANAATLTLSALPFAERLRLVDEWVDRGGGAKPLFNAEAVEFLGYLATRLPAGSHAISVCHLETAVLIAQEAAATFLAEDSDRLDSASPLRAGRSAARVDFYGEPHAVLAAIQSGKDPPPLGEPHAMIVAPGLASFAQPAGLSEIWLWESLAVPRTVATLLSEGHERNLIDVFVSAGIAEIAATTT